MGLEADLRGVLGVLFPLMVLGLGIILFVRRHILVSQTRYILRSSNWAANTTRDVQRPHL